MKGSPGPGSTETASEGAEDLLYDVLVLREWTSTGAAASKNGNSSAAITTAECALSATSGDCKVAIADEVDDGGGGVGVLHGGAIEILAKTPNGGSGGGYVGVTKVPVPPDECPQLSRLTWSSDGRLLVHAASNGRIFVYDESGTPIYSILSQASSLVSITTDTEL